MKPSLGLLSGVVALCFLSGVTGGWVALALYEPEVLVTERVVEVLPPPPDLDPHPDDLADLTRLYAELAGVEAKWTGDLVHELAGVACNNPYTLATDIESLSEDPAITVSASILENFVESEVLPRCRTG